MFPLMRLLAKTLMEPSAKAWMPEPSSGTDAAWTGETGGGISDFALEAHKGAKSNSVVYINPHKTLFYEKKIRSTLLDGALG